MDLCDDLANLIRDHIIDYNTGAGTWTAPAATYLRLFTADPTADPESSSDEVAGGSYVGQLIEWVDAGTGTAETDDTITFANMPAVTVTHAAIAEDDAGSSTWYLFGELTTPKTIASAGDALTIAIGDLDFTFS